MRIWQIHVKTPFALHLHTHTHTLALSPAALATDRNHLVMRIKFLGSRKKQTKNFKNFFQLQIKSKQKINNHKIHQQLAHTCRSMAANSQKHRCQLNSCKFFSWTGPDSGRSLVTQLTKKLMVLSTLKLF